MTDLRKKGLQYDDATVSIGDTFLVKRTAPNTVGKGNFISENVIKELHELATLTNTESGSHEVGATVATTTFNWTYNRNTDDPFSQILSGTDLTGTPITVAVALRTLAGAFAPNLSPATATTYTYTMNAVGDDVTWGATIGNPSSNTTSIPFLWKMYYGVSADGTLFTGPDIITTIEPQNDDFATSKTKSYAFTPVGADNYVYFAWPASFGAVATSLFNGLAMTAWSYSNGVSFGHAAPTNIPLTNASGGTTNYYVIRSDNVYNGPSTWAIT